MVIFNNQTISKIEVLANNLEQKAIDGSAFWLVPKIVADTELAVVVAWLSTQLQKQKKLDFKPRNDEMIFSRVNTDPCVGCCDTLEKIRDAAKSNMSGQNLESFLTEIGVTFHRFGRYYS